MANLTSFSLLAAFINLSLEITDFFLFLLEQMEIQQWYLLLFTAIDIYPTMTTSAFQNPGNVKSVH